MVYYKNGLANTEHTLKVTARGEKNPHSEGNNVYIDAVQFSNATGSSGFGSGGGPTDAQRMIFGYTSRYPYIDSSDNQWLPGTEFVVRTGRNTDSVAKTWWTMKQAIDIENTTDPELYQYGVHAPEFWVNITVGPGNYHVRLKFAETQYIEANKRSMTIYINGEKVAENLDVYATAGAANKAVDLVYNNIKPKNGAIEVRLKGAIINGCQAEAILQALEVGPGSGGQGAKPVAVGKTQN